LVKVPPELLPDKLLKKAQHIVAKYNFKKLTNFYTFEEYGILTLQNSEKIAERVIKNNITKAGISREYILRTFGIELADKVFPQYKRENKQGTTAISDTKHLIISKRILDTIQQNGFCLEKDIFNNKSEYIQWKRSIQEILNIYDLVKIRVNKDLKTKYNIAGDGYPSIIINRETAQI